MNRIDRLAAIMLQLQSRKIVKAQDIATKFSISLRTVYRDIHALEQGGVPVIGEAGTGYRLMEGYKLPPLMFNKEEAAALLTAARLVQSKADDSIFKHYSTALDKIRAVLRVAEKDHLEEIDEHIAVMKHPAVAYAQPQDLHLQVLLKAIGEKAVVEFSYTSIEKNETSRRKSEPVGIYNLGSHWYLVAFCLLRNDYRNFRTDKMRNIVFTGEAMAQVHPPLERFIRQMSCERQLQQVVVDVEPGTLKYFGDQKYYNGFVKEERCGDYIRMTFLAGSLHGFARWFMLFGDRAKIVEPLKLNTIVAEIAENILKNVVQPELLLT